MESFDQWFRYPFQNTSMNSQMSHRESFEKLKFLQNEVEHLKNQLMKLQEQVDGANLRIQLLEETAYQNQLSITAETSIRSRNQPTLKTLRTIKRR
ncbi:hypothetical protein LSG31_15660 [Fodinisporobacter ferrooxydans]|uniref:Uncharacterized protein n=1 Tax=Fodinisporobacter ferrooxydans TaxID=2901836 RepID=A0ABY4CJJ1_9BACL|nr:hypothetical protein LSG31_15660 [Alicyclobacillaceae bacterium MYW30-H2]